MSSKKTTKESREEFFPLRKSVFVLLFILALVFEAVFANLAFISCVLPESANPRAKETVTVSDESFVITKSSNSLGIVSTDSDIHTIEIKAQSKEKTGKVTVSVFATDDNGETDGKLYAKSRLSVGKGEPKTTRLYIKGEDADYLKLVFDTEGGITISEITLNPDYKISFNFLRFFVLAIILAALYILTVKKVPKQKIISLIQNKRVRAIAFGAVLPALILIFTFGIICYYILYPAEGYLHSDCTDTILWARASFESGKLISDDFSYAALLPFAGNLLMGLYMPFFGYSMTTHNLGMITFALLLILAVVFFCRSLKMSYLRSSIVAFCLFFTLSSSDKLREIMWGHIIYYSLGVLFFLVGFGILFRIQDKYANDSLQNKKIPQIVLSLTGGVRGLFLNIALAVFCALTATNGTQSLLTFILPLLCAIVLERVTANEKEGYIRASLNSGVTLCFTGVGTLFGLLLGKRIIGDAASGYATAYSSYDDFADWVDNLLIFPDHYFSLLGVDVKLYDPLVSLDSVFTMIKVFGGLALLILPIVYFVRVHKQNNSAGKLLAYGHFALCALLMYAYICGLLSTANWRLVPMLASCIIVSAVAVFDLIGDEKLPSLRRLGVLLLVLLLLLSFIPCREIKNMERDYGQNNALHVLTQGLMELDEEGILPEVGYATFWNCQAVTLLSDDEIKLRGINTDGTPTRYEYQQMLSWYDEENFKDGSYLVLTASEEIQLRLWISGEGSDFISRRIVGSYIVYIYDYNVLK